LPTLEDIVSAFKTDTLAIGKLLSPSLLRETLDIKAVFPPKAGHFDSEWKTC
jgi:hypothetical protein